MKLFRVITETNYFSCHDAIYSGVTLHWFCKPTCRWGARYSPATYCECIEEPGDGACLGHAKAFIDELFIGEEAKMLLDYLRRRHPVGTHRTEQIALPIPASVIGFSAHPEEASTGFYKLDRERGYDLPFVARAFYDLSQSERVVNRFGAIKLPPDPLDLPHCDN